MTAIRKNETICGPAIACGAAYVSLDHKPGEPTSIDNAVAAIKRLFTHKPVAASARTSADQPVANKVAAAHGDAL